MVIKKIIVEIEDLMAYYRDAKLFGELFGLKTALEIIKRVVKMDEVETDRGV